LARSTASNVNRTKSRRYYRKPGRPALAGGRWAHRRLFRVPEPEFPLFALGLVALPGELIPLHIFEQRYRAMIAHCLQSGSEFGIVWMAQDGLHDIGCAMVIEQVLEELEDGRMNILTRGTRPFRVIERQDISPTRPGSSSSSRTKRTHPTTR